MRRGRGRRNERCHQVHARGRRPLSGQVGALSLVSHAFLETWRHRTGTSLTVAAFRATGGLRGAVSQNRRARLRRARPG
ncbi:hypothetical protein [Nonomuraea turkmeniaca]|uniref:nSTAND1 domain-containing NTPase n=1 Tax=Nonomuraea turkmeniaca TaxID=103838 RepID=UPI003CCC474C